MIQDGNLTSTTVTDGVLSIGGFTPGESLSVQYWATSGAATSPIATTGRRDRGTSI